jgi:hypothetical protein
MMADGRWGDSERLAKLASVEELAMVVSEHLPQAMKSFGRHSESELGNIPFKKGANELLTPTAGNLGAGSQQAVWKAAS